MEAIERAPVTNLRFRESFPKEYTGSGRTKGFCLSWVGRVIIWV